MSDNIKISMVEKKSLRKFRHDKVCYLLNDLSWIFTILLRVGSEKFIFIYIVASLLKRSFLFCSIKFDFHSGLVCESEMQFNKAW